MEKRVVWLHAIFLFCFSILTVRLSVLGQGDTLAQAAARQSSSLLELGSSRGFIYDRNGKPLVNRGSVTAMAVTPTLAGIEALRESLSPDDFPAALEVLRQGRPMVVRSAGWLSPVTREGVVSFRLPVRYAGEQLAVHLLGYLDESGHGVTGVEKGYDDLLREMGGSIYARYFVDANRSAVAGEATEVVDQRAAPLGGVVLTLDRDIQRRTEAAMDRVGKGAAVVMDVDTGEILAMVSRPVYDLTRIADFLDDPDSPFFNRALGAYNLGSVFKLCVAAAALEKGWSVDYTYSCGGFFQLGEQKFHCHNRYGHGPLDMSGALEHSCNPYFINLGMQLGGQTLYNMAYAMGFGAPGYLGEEVISSSGELPTSARLTDGALANFSFGQGELTATPVQVAQMVSIIANGGHSVQPRVYLGRTLDGGNLLRDGEPEPSRQVISSRTAATLREMMIGVVENGSGSNARPDRGGAGGKTSTAQTGISRGEEELLHGWFAGFYPAEDPQYAVVVLAEGGGEGSETPARTFAAICDGIAELTAADDTIIAR